METKKVSEDILRPSEDSIKFCKSILSGLELEKAYDWSRLSIKDYEKKYSKVELNIKKE